MANILDQEEWASMVEKAQQESFVLIKFEGFGRAEFVISKNNVNPAQVLGAISILELQVKNWYIQEENMKREQQLAVPQNKILTPK